MVRTLQGFRALSGLLGDFGGVLGGFRCRCAEPEPPRYPRKLPPFPIGLDMRTGFAIIELASKREQRKAKKKETWNLVQTGNGGKIHIEGCGLSSHRVRKLGKMDGAQARETYGKQLCSKCFPANKKNVAPKQEHIAEEGSGKEIHFYRLESLGNMYILAFEINDGDVRRTKLFSSQEEGQAFLRGLERAAA